MDVIAGNNHFCQKEMLSFLNFFESKNDDYVMPDYVMLYLTSQFKMSRLDDRLPLASRSPEVLNMMCPRSTA
jgi:hypothetical protein